MRGGARRSGGPAAVGGPLPAAPGTRGTPGRGRRAGAAGAAGGGGRGGEGAGPSRQRASPYDEAPYRQPTNPGNALKLGLSNFNAQFGGIVDTLADLVPPRKDLARAPAKFGFTLSNRAIFEREQQFPAPGPNACPAAIQAAYDGLIATMDWVFEKYPIERFWFLETVARIPYFSYVTVLHFYETIGWWRTGELRMIHNAEEWNELHHLLIMEALGGNRKWWVRFLAQHSALAYYWALVGCYLVSPQWSYKFSEMLEQHAVNTYSQFLEENAERLKGLPAPDVAVNYYTGPDLYLFDLDSSMVRGNDPPRRPPVDSLYDVFLNIRDDEWEHVKTMVACQDYDTLGEYSIGASCDFEDMSGAQKDFYMKNRRKWEIWSEKINDLRSTGATNPQAAEGAREDSPTSR